MTWFAGIWVSGIVKMYFLEVVAVAAAYKFVAQWK